jgi:hypothetical protein
VEQDPSGFVHFSRACLLNWFGVQDCGGQYDASAVGTSAVGERVFVVSGGDAPPLFESAEAAFDGVAFFVEFGLEYRWPAPFAALVLAVLPLVTAFGDRVFNPPGA